MNGKILVVELDVSDDRTKRDAMRIVAGIIGIHSMEFGEGAQKKMTVWCGRADPFEVVKRLRKLVRTTVVSIGPPPKAAAAAAEQPKKEEVKKRVYTEAEVDKLIHATRVEEMAYFMNGHGFPPYIQPNTFFSNSSLDEPPPGCTIF